MNLTPKQIVAALDRYIIGQPAAKKAVAIAIRNRWRRQRLPEDMRREVSPKNIIMMGPTGVGKTEIARRLAALVRAPFIKVEATKYTEVGYHGRDVESMIRDLVEQAVNMVKGEQLAEVKPRAAELAEDRLLDALLPRTGPAGFGRPDAAGPGGAPPGSADPFGFGPGSPGGPGGTDPASTTRRAGDGDGDDDGGGGSDGPGSFERTREKLRKKLRAGELDERLVELDLPDSSTQFLDIFSSAGIEQLGVDLRGMLGPKGPRASKTRKLKVGEARTILESQEAEKLLDQEKVHREAIDRVENAGLVFVDEIDKIAFQGSRSGPDVSREGVQRDLLPIVEGSTVVTRYGAVDTAHILFIAAGAFHMTSVSDLIPELQGRFPIRVELTELGGAEFRRILTEPNNAITKQYAALLETEGVRVEFTDDGIDEIATIAERHNKDTQDIGARRLQTVMEKLLEEVAFEGSDGEKHVRVDREYVRSRLSGVLADQDLARYVL